MADFGIGRTGGSLRDALNAAIPMAGMGEYNTAYPPLMFPPRPQPFVAPPAAGADQPGPSIPLPQPRPPTAPQGLPQPAPYGGPQQNRFVPGLPGYPGVPGQAPLSRPPLPQGGLPPGLQFGLQGEGGQGQPLSYAARLGLGGQF